jgi:hypothetical protein
VGTHIANVHPETFQDFFRGLGKLLDRVESHYIFVEPKILKQLHISAPYREFHG